MKNNKQALSLSQRVEYKIQHDYDQGDEPIITILEQRVVQGRMYSSSVSIAESDMPELLLLLQQSMIEMQLPDSDTFDSLVSEPIMIETEQQAKTYCLTEVRKKYPRAYMPWSQEEDEELVHQYCQGHKVKDMAIHFGRGKGAISSRIKKLSLREIYDVA